MILVDTDVLLDVVLDDPAWADWSQRRLEMAGLQGAAVLTEGGFELHEIPREALFLAGTALLEDWKRSRAAVKRSVLPDFFIGAQRVRVGDWRTLRVSATCVENFLESHVR